MKTIILSAGKGERLLPLTKDRPKILVELGDGTSLLSRQTEILSRHPLFNEIVVGAGYCVEKVEAFASEAREKAGISVIYNPFYAVSGPLVTLWVVLNKISDSGFIFMNGDTLYSETVYSRLDRLYSDSKEGIFLLCSRAEDVAPDDIKIKFDDKNYIREASKSITGHDAVSAGLMIVIGEKSSAAFRSVLNEAARRDDFLNHNKTWHSFIKDLADAGVEIEPLIVEKSEWAEVDIHFDLQQLRSLLESSLAKNKFNF